MLKKNIPTWQKAFISFALPFIAGGAGSMATANSIRDWYSLLNKPIFNPPNWLFGPVWTILYFAMGLATYWMLSTNLPNKNLPARQKALTFWLIQLALNLMWTLMFFGEKQIALAFLIIIALISVFTYMTVLYYKINKKTLWLLIPTICWMSFAAILNLSILLLN